LRKKAEQGDADAQYKLGILCARAAKKLGKDNSEKYEAGAVVWYRKAAEQGYAKAQYVLGHCHYIGKGVVKNIAEAVKWYRKAAEQGNAHGQNNLGNCYITARG